MSQTLIVPVRLPPGLFRNGTRYQSQGRWYDGNLIRFAEGTILPVGGWSPIFIGAAPWQVVGSPRNALAWRSNGGQPYLAVATVGGLVLGAEGLYWYSEGQTADITPIDLPPGRPSAGFPAQIGGYGMGYYGVGPYGRATQTATTVIPLDNWSLDTFGEFLIAVRSPNNGVIYVWNLQTAKAERITPIAGIVPTARAVVTTPERFLFALGADGNGRKIAWPSQEGIDDWLPTDVNSAGDFTLEGASDIVSGRRGRNETLIWTTSALFSAQYIGQPLVYRFDRKGENCGLVGPNAVAAIGGAFVWMGDREFFYYDGAVRQLNCDVLDYVFSEFSDLQKAKVYAMVLPLYNEVWWFYPSGQTLGADGQPENDRYVAWSVRENHWSYGFLPRGAGIDASGVFQNPVMVGTNGIVYEHELVGASRPDYTPPPGRPANAMLTSGPFELATGEVWTHVYGIVPDEQLNGIQQTGSVDAYLYFQPYPTAPETKSAAIDLTTKTDLRFSARQVRLELLETVRGNWRIGIPRFLLKPGERR